MKRVVEPEWLDFLPAADPRATASRRDLRRVNWLTGSAAILAGAIARAATRPPRILVDLGAGDGSLALRLARRLSARWPDVRLRLVDRTPSIASSTLAAIAQTCWQVETVAADAEEWCRSGAGESADIVVANLFLHHFGDEALSRLLHAVAARTSIFAASEPRRGAVALAGSRLLGLIGCNDVTRHDAVVSVRAGFARNELSALWPRDGWSLSEGRAGWSSHLFVARSTAMRNGAGAS